MATRRTASGRNSESPARRLARRVGIGAAVVAFLYFAIDGGEYGTRDVLARASRADSLALEVARKEAELDSLRAELVAVEKDPATLERIAREEFGMVRGSREVLYRFADVDSQPAP
jgi:cell division protein FtsB